MLEDDRHYFPPYECAIAVRDDTLRRFPGPQAALAELSGRIIGPAMRRMNEQVDIDHQARRGRGARIPRYVETSAWK